MSHGAESWRERNVEDFLSKYTHLETKKNRLDVFPPDSIGLFGNCTMTLWALTNTYPSDRFVMVNWPAQRIWRDHDQTGENLFDLYFDQNRKTELNQLTRLPPVDHHGVYSALPFDELKAYVQNYFFPSKSVLTIQEELERKYKIDYESTVALWYRGTDKWTELSSISPRYFILEAQRLLANYDDLKILVQTDQEQVRDECIASFGKKAFYIEELPVTTALVGIHHIPAETRGISNFRFGTTLLAVSKILSKCRYLLTSTGGFGFWACLYRGTTNNTAQFRSQPPDLILDYGGKLEHSNMASNPREVYELRLENARLRSELNAIRNSFAYRCRRRARDWLTSFHRS